MSGGLSWAMTEPSTNSTSEWTIDCGWTSTSSCRAGTPKSQRASMSSSALFIIVAESTVIFGPIDQVGWRSASAGVTSASVAAGRVRKGPPLAVRRIRATSVGRPEQSA